MVKRKVNEEGNFFKIIFSGEKVISDDKAAKDLYGQSRFGEIISGKIRYSFVEALYLSEKGKVKIFDGRNKELSFDNFVKKARKFEPNFWVKYCVFRDIRSRGYIVKTALKFGAEFRVYGRGVKPGQDHAKWILYPINEGSTLTWYDFAAKNRVAHSTKKRLLVGIVDEEDDVTYYEIKWIRP